MKLEPSKEDDAFLTRLFGPRIPQDDMSFRPALEWCAYIEVAKSAAPDEDTWEYIGKPMVAGLVSHFLYIGNGNRTIVGWSLEEIDVPDAYVLGVLVVKRETKAA